MDDAVDGSLRRGGRAPTRKRKRTKRTTPASSTTDKAVYYQRPKIPRTSKQAARHHIKRFSSGRTAVLPYFTGVKPTRIRRYGGRFRGGRNVAGVFTPSIDPLEMQRATEAAARQQTLNAAIEKAAKRGSWTPMDTSELEAAGVLAKAVKQQEEGRDREEDTMKVEHRLAAKELVKNMAGNELEQASMNHEREAVMKAARDQLWKNEDSNEKSLERQSEKFINDWDDNVKSRLNEIDSRMRLAEEGGNEKARNNLHNFKTTFQSDMEARIIGARERVKDLKNLYKSATFEPDDERYGGEEFFDAQESTSRFEPSRLAWGPLQAKFEIDKNEMKRAYEKALQDVNANSMPRLNFHNAHTQHKLAKHKGEVKQYQEAQSLYKTQYQKNYDKKFDQIWGDDTINDSEKVGIAEKYAQDHTTPTGKYAEYGEKGVPKLVLPTVKTSKQAVTIRKLGDLKIFITSLIRDGWTMVGTAGKVLTVSGALALGAQIDNVFGTQLQTRIGELAGKSISSVVGQISSLILQGTMATVGGAMWGTGTYLVNTLTGWGKAAERDQQRMEQEGRI